MGALPNRRALGLFANILEYPHPDVAADIHECEELLRAEHPEAAELMQRFGAFADAQPVGGLEETHTALFDLDSDLHPYIGYQLFGETYERSQLLLGLKELYRAGGFESKSTELPDRISEMLRYFSVGTNDAAIDEVLREGMLPALESMTTNVEQDETQPTPVTDPYWLVIEALLLFLQPHAVAAPAVAVTTGASQ